MSNVNTRLNVIEKRLYKRDYEVSFFAILRIDRLIYYYNDESIPSERKITIQEWEAYRESLLRNAKDKEGMLRQLAGNEEYLKNYDAFIKI